MIDNQGLYEQWRDIRQPPTPFTKSQTKTWLLLQINIMPISYMKRFSNQDGHRISYQALPLAPSTSNSPIPCMAGSTATSHQLPANNQHWYPIFYPTFTSLPCGPFLSTSHTLTTLFYALSNAPRQPGYVILSRLFCFAQPHRSSSQQPSARLGQESSSWETQPLPSARKHHIHQDGQDPSLPLSADCPTCICSCCL